MKIIRALASLKLAIVLMALSMVLILAGTLAQREMPIWEVQKQFFHSPVTWVHVKHFLPAPPAGQQPVSLRIPMPGGYVLGLAMLINLLAAHVSRFRWGWSRAGVIMVHAGLILLLVGEGITSEMSRDASMMITEGQSANFASDERAVELALADTSPADHDEVVAFDGRALKEGAVLRHGLLPFEVRVEEFYANSELIGPEQARRANITPRGTSNIGALAGVSAIRRPPSAGTEGGRDMASAYVTLMLPDGEKVTYLVSAGVKEPESIRWKDKTWLLSLRFKRYYKPYSVQLIKFRHDRYPGTNTPRNFSSEIRLIDPERGVNRPVLIRMNSPLRYRGETFYQARYVGENTTILEVVANPGWVIPYVSCVIAGAGMILHFVVMLAKFLSGLTAERPKLPPLPTVGPPPLPLETREVSPTGRNWAATLFAGAVTLLCAGYVLSHARPAKNAGEFDANGFARLPISFEGRVQPLDTVGRNMLKMFGGREEARLGETKVAAAEWLLDTMSDRPGSDGRPAADAYTVFRIDEPGLVSILSSDSGQKYFSMNELIAKEKPLQEQFQRLDQVSEKEYDRFQTAVARLYRNVRYYISLRDMSTLRVVPPGADDADFRPVRAQNQTSDDPGFAPLRKILEAYKARDAGAFNSALADYRGMLDTRLPAEMKRVRFEAFYNQFSFAYYCMALYVIVAILAAFSWMGWRKGFGRAAYWLLILTFAVHTLGLGARIYIAGRPPVTNLYSSAVFISWVGVLLAIIVEAIFRNGLATFVAGLMGFAALLVGHAVGLSDAAKGSPDTMRVLQAVLDTQFWLVVHVLTVTIGYSGVFIAGVLGIVYVIRGVFTKSLDEQSDRMLARQIYGILAFSLIFSFIGTVTGGIWADQSWGRFWGWDPKENGAVLIVLWCAIVLHARWDRWAGNRGLAVLAIFGNIVTAWSWFGTNMLGVGLHSYGFMDSAAFWLGAFMFLNIGLMIVGSLPRDIWQSRAVPVARDAG